MGTLLPQTTPAGMTASEQGALVGLAGDVAEAGAHRTHDALPRSQGSSAASRIDPELRLEGRVRAKPSGFQTARRPVPRPVGLAPSCGADAPCAPRSAAGCPEPARAARSSRSVVGHVDLSRRSCELATRSAASDVPSSCQLCEEAPVRRRLLTSGTVRSGRSALRAQQRDRDARRLRHASPPYLSTCFERPAVVRSSVAAERGLDGTGT